MPPIKNIYRTMPDGTLKHINPLTGTEVWTVPDRAHRPLYRSIHQPKSLQTADPENYCDFCQANYLKTPPEKNRLIQTLDGSYQKLEQLNPAEIHNTQAIFRRVANLFEIVTLDYWLKNHGFQISAHQAQWQISYLAHPEGLEHVLQMITTKLKLIGKTPEELVQMSETEKLRLAESFFAGGHELIIAQKHFKTGAQWDTDLVSSGDLTREEHYQYFQYTIDALIDIYANNPFVRYVTVFQNWLQPAGASLEHLHRQLVGIDEWGASIESELEIVRKNPNVYNKAIINFSINQNLIVAENNQAIAVAELGHRFPTLVVYSKSPQVRPEDHSPEELRGVSDLIHACHAATGNQVPCNEEWYYTPRDAKVLMPWHILIKWRTNNLAGFEGGTKIYINPISPMAQKNLLIPRLYELRQQGKIQKIKIGDECQSKLNSLLYGQT
jgi:galactose-1-phosphate uridylyltransferase